MEGRLARLEEDMLEARGELYDFKAKLPQMEGRTDGRFKAIHARFNARDTRFNSIEARLSQVPTTRQVFTFMLSAMAGIFAIVRYGMRTKFPARNLTSTAPRCISRRSFVPDRAFTDLFAV